ncbi:flagellar basal body P-ring formation chaperone FlgA [Desulfurispira natronophila]|uniref:Flagella basal body P-ring formation protein FlgA n=1 Tax=Desulfurispira natronophila TaxID=682562 RepID=A0A7W8DGV5_9BACT|nr:flagellar basal body P-ring formation chaperone FlgA [Desulfurispira natronophila]MBB5021749.1 flagella basal body P-ring formation protein FlgA [Desulfurispira natronophila]
MRILLSLVTALVVATSVCASGFPVFQNGSTVSLATPSNDRSIAGAAQANTRQREEDIRQAINSFLQQELSEIAEVDRLIYPSDAPLQGKELYVEGSVRSSGHSSLEVFDRYGNTIMVRASIKRFVEAYVPVRNISRGERVSESDFRLEQLPAHQARNALDIYQTDFDSMVVANRNLHEGQLLRNTDLRRQYAVQRGDIVEVLYQHNRMTISMAAVSTERGYLGDVVQLRNPTSGSTIMARLLPGKRAEIIY